MALNRSACAAHPLRLQRRPASIEEADVAARRWRSRYLATNRMRVVVLRSAGRRVCHKAPALLVEAFELAQQIGMGFFGSSLLAGMARSAETPARTQALSAGRRGHARVQPGPCTLVLLPGRHRHRAAGWELGRGACAMPKGSNSSFGTSPWLSPNWWPPAPARWPRWDQRGPEPAILAELTSLRERLTLAGFRGLVPEIDAALERELARQRRNLTPCLDGASRLASHRACVAPAVLLPPPRGGRSG